MGAITAASSNSGQGVLKVFKFTAITDNDTFTGPAAPKAYWLASESTTVGANAVESSGTYTFHTGGDGAAGTLFVLT